MVEKRHAGRDRASAGAIKLEPNRDVGFTRFTGERG
jgi:hypothetical protein